MYCGSCGKEIKDDAKFCSKCGATQTPKSYTPPSFPSKGSTTIKRKLPIIVIAIVLVLIASIVGCCMSRSKNGMKSGEDAAAAYLVARYEQDADTIISLVPDEVLKEIMKQYDCSKKQLIQAVKDELPSHSKYYSNCESIKDSKEIRSINEKNYYNYLCRVEYYINLEKVSKMIECEVHVERDRYYDDIVVYQYGNDKNTWYSTDAADFVLHSVKVK